jgi:hypothetical protein
MIAKSLNNTALAGSGRAGDAYAERVAGGREAVFDDLLGEFSISGVRAFDQGDGLGEDGAIGVADAIDILAARQNAAACGDTLSAVRWLGCRADGSVVRRVLFRFGQVRQDLRKAWG